MMATQIKGSALRFAEYSNDTWEIYGVQDPSYPIAWISWDNEGGRYLFETGCGGCYNVHSLADVIAFIEKLTSERLTKGNE